jgi:siroheme synthase-like protein
MARTYLPISITLSDRRCLVVGGGSVALRKIETLLDFGAIVVVIAPVLSARIEAYAGKNLVELIKREYQSPEASDYDLVISASDDQEVNRQVASDCSSNRIPVNVVDNPALCSFIFPALLRRDALSVAISTNGRAPFLAARIKLILEDIFPQHWAQMVRLAGLFRDKTQERFPTDPAVRAERYAGFLNLDWKTLMSQMSEEDIEKNLDELVGESAASAPGNEASAEEDGGQ